MKRAITAVVCTIAAWCSVAAPPSIAAAAARRTVLLISFDGWRWDYLDRLPAPNLKALAARGVRANALIPSFPTLTFPNHYTIVTGLYPAHHGIVSNEMEEPGFGAHFAMAAATAKDPRWWGGEPIWVTASKAGLHTASIFWPGDEVPIEGVRPDVWLPFDDKYPNGARVSKVLDWIAQPDDQRPAFIALYFSDVDHAGHDYGPDSPQLAAAAAELDRRLGDIIAGIDRLGADDRVDLVVVSDHGMTPVRGRVYLDDFISIDAVHVVDWNALLQIAPAATPDSGPPSADAVRRLDEIYGQLHDRLPHVRVYHKRDLPQRLHYRDNARIAPLLGLAEEGWVVTSHAREAQRVLDRKPPQRGEHGYDPEYSDMRALFVAAGPDIRSDATVGAFPNVDVYDFLCGLLQLSPAPNDGDPAISRELLKR